MNRLFIIGNCTKDPEMRTTPAGKTVCSFTVAVNRRGKKKDDQQETDYFRVSAWDALGDNCGKYLTKGKKVAVVGAVSVHSYKTAKGDAGASLEVLASEVEFLTPREAMDQSGMQRVTPENNPFVDDIPY
jgi:single-strand DNA-binding protein